jgi:hypothetical protein
MDNPATKKGKGKGLDGTSSWLLWTLHTMNNSTMHIVGSAILNCDYPSNWKEDLKVPVQKPTKTDAPEHLISELAKVTEGVIRGCIESIMEHDAGFRMGEINWDALSDEVTRLLFTAGLGSNEELMALLELFKDTFCNRASAEADEVSKKTIRLYEILYDIGEDAIGKQKQNEQRFKKRMVRRRLRST